MGAIRVCFMGDSITTGTGDADATGWPGRLCAAEAQRGNDVSCYNLGIRGQTTPEIAARWLIESEPRLPPHVDGRIVFMFGVNDAAEQDGVGRRVDPAETLSGAERMISSAAKRWPVLWLGPTPVVEGDVSISPGPGVTYRFSRARTAELNDGFRTLAGKLNVPYLDFFELLSGNEYWDAAMTAGDGVHPTGPGYAVMASAIEEWNAWRAWLD